MISTIRARVKIQYSLLIFLILSLFLGQIAYALLFLLIIMAHEAGHMGALLLFRGKIEQLNITIVGGIIDINDCGLNTGQNLIVSVSGIAMNGLILFIVPKLNLDAEMASVIIAYNKLMIAFNLLPIYPLDGSRIIEVFLCMIFDEEYAMDISMYVSWIFLTLLSIYSMISRSGAIIIISVFLLIKLLQRKSQMRYSLIRNNALNYALFSRLGRLK
jgi:stage IV sporulation protein FB